MSRKRNKHDTSAVASLRGVAADPRLSTQSLKASGGIEDAALFLSRRISKAGSGAAEGILRDLSSAPDILALLLTSHRDFRSSILAMLFHDTSFPATKESYITSIHSVLLKTLKAFFSGVSPTTDLDSTRYSEQMASISSTHQHIIEVTLPTTSPTSPTISLGFTMEPHPRRKSSVSTKSLPKRFGRRNRNYRHRRRNSYYSSDEDEDEDVDEDRFDDEGSLFSDSQGTIDPIAEYYETVTALLDTQRKSLEYFFHVVLPSPSMGRRVREMVLKVIEAPTEMELPYPTTSNVPSLASDVAETVPPPDSASTNGVNDFLEFPRISPGKAKILFDSPDGWGPWHLYLSSNAIKDLRGFYRTDRATYEMVQQKMKQLSDGFFSKSNQKLLVGGPNDVHFYEAKLSRDLRLVYRVELSSDEELKLDRQVLFIYGLYTHTQLDRKDFWNQVAHHSPRSDVEYRRRCDARARPIKGGTNVDNMIPPMEWPHGEYPITVKPSLPGVSEEDLLDLHKITSLEKFIPWSRNVLETILADVDAVHRFAVSPTETAIINHDSSCFVVGRSGTGKTTTMIFKMLGIELAVRQLPQLWDGPRPRQMFLTQSHVLARRVEDYYKQLFHAAQFVQSSGSFIARLEEDLLDMDEEDDERVDLPSKFSLLEDKHFPLFVTFDQLRHMLESDLGVSFVRRKLPKRSTVSVKLSSLPINDADDLLVGARVDSEDSIKELRSYFVSFSVFLSSFWPHFDQRITKGLDPALVFSEIMGVISGHETVADSEMGYLSHDSYISLSHRSHSTLFHHREQIYQIFERYVKLKQTAGMYDTSDRTHTILRALNDHQVGNIDFLYVDEVQDLRIIDTKLLGELCPNPHGTFWGGDTAQTISVGSSFRFEELKTLMYHAESQHRHVLAGLRPAIHPSLFQLLVNYRSHGGIVDCAASIVELLASKFPGSIDRLRRETALVTGPKPVLFRSDVVPFEEFMGAGQGARLDFGADQVILVRDEEARHHLRRLLGDSGLILTLLESKGLEFDDVLLYNFFTSSPASLSKWRIVHTEVREVDKHRTVEAELKRLYVAVTRARHHCWIWEQAGSSIPMIDYWNQAGLIRVHKSDEPIPKLATESSPERWRKIGMDLFARKLYITAASCFGKAGEVHEQQICFAFDAREKASDKASYLAVAAKFKEVALVESSMSLGLFRRAGECFRDGGNYVSAAEAFVSARVFTEAARLYRKAGRFIEAVDLVKRESEVDSDVRETIIEVAKLEFVRTNNLKQAAIVFDNDVEEQLEYMETYGFGMAKSALYQQLGDFEAAGNVHEQAGETLLAVKCFLRSQHHSVRRRAIPQVLERLRSVAFHTEFLMDSHELLNLLRPLDAADFDDDEKVQMTIFRAIAKKDSQLLKDLAWTHRQHHFYRVLCQNQALFCSPSSLENLKLPQLQAELAFVSHYTWSLVEMSRFRDNLAHHLHAASLFGIRVSPNPDHKHLSDHYVINRLSFLGRAYLGLLTRQGHYDSGEPEILLPAMKLDELVRQVVAQTVRANLENLHEQLLKLSVLRPCIDFLVRGFCGRVYCDRDHDAIRLPNYPDLIIRTVLWVVEILNNLFYLPSRNEYYDANRLRTIRNIWVSRFFQVLQPLSHQMGRALAHREFPSKPHHILQGWVATSISSYQPFLRNDIDRFFLSDVLSAAWMAYILHDSQIPPYIPTTSTIFYHRQDLVRPGASFGVVTDLLCALDRERGGEGRLWSGVLALRHIIESGIDIELQGLIVFLEHVALEVILNIAHSRGADADGLVLPRSWAIRGFWHRMTAARNPKVDLLFEALGLVMSKIASGSGTGALLHYRKEMPMTSTFRQLCLSRICRLLVLLGRNLGQWARPAILSTVINSLSPLTQTLGMNMPYRVLRPFATAKNWAQLEHALYESSPRGDNDYLVAFFYRQRRHFQLPSFPPNIKIIWYTTKRDIYQALGVTSYVSNSLQEAPYPGPLPIPNPGNAVGVAPAVVTVSEPLIPVPGSPLLESSGDRSEVIESPLGDPTSEGRASQELSAAIAIQRWYRDIILRRTIHNAAGDQLVEEQMEQSRPETELQAAKSIQLWYRSMLHKRSIPRDHFLAKHHTACVAQVELVSESSLFPLRRRLYIATIQGALPHALCSLDRILAASFDTRDATRKLILTAEHQALEKTHFKMNQLISIIKETKRLMKTLSPGSPVFLSGDMLQLRAIAKEVVELGHLAQEHVSFQNLQALQQDLDLTYHGIVEEPHAVIVQKAELGSLNTEDLYE